MIVRVENGAASWNGRQARCVLGRGGLIAARDKREGDGATPAGAWPVRRVLYRPDRGPAPQTKLLTRAIAGDDGWCDAPGDPAYNRPVRLPYRASAETMTREDGLYDLVLVIGHNDDPPEPGMGSAIFVHCAAPDWKPTEGCVALAKDDLRALLGDLAPGDIVEIAGP